MTVSIWPDHLLTLAEWDELPEDLGGRSELVEGVLLVVPSPAARHQFLMAVLCAELNRQLPAQYRAVPDVDVVLDVDPLPTVRRPDVVVLPRNFLDANAPRLAGADVVLAVEIVSPGSGRTDRVTKMAEYAAAGIPNYWIVELGPPAEVSVFTMVNHQYELTAGGSGALEVTCPAPLTIDVDALIAL